MPPVGSTLAGGAIDVSLYADGHGFQASGTAVVYSPSYAYDGSDVVFQCDWGLAPCSNGTNDFTGVIALPSSRGGNLYVSAGCGGTKGAVCNEGGSNGAWSLVRVAWADLLLTNSSTPTGSGFAGTLLAAGARGARELTFTAGDPGGPGVYSVTVQIDGKTLYTGTPDTNGGKCAPVGATAGALMFDYSQPCRTSEALDLPVETVAVPDGPHTLKVTVQDAAQNSAVVYDNTITTQNAPAASSPPVILGAGQATVGVALGAQAGGWSAPAGAGSIGYAYQWEDCDAQGSSCQLISGAQSATYLPAPSDVGHTLRVLLTASDSDGSTSTSSAASSAVLPAPGSLGTTPGPGTGLTPTPAPGITPSGSGAPSAAAAGLGPGAPNGSGASESSVLHLGVSHALSRAYARRAFKLTGRLLTGGHPISGAALDIVQQIAGSNSQRTVAHVRTRSDGSFSVQVPAGPSRVVKVAYRAFANDAGYAAQASLKEAVKPSVRLHITPSRTASREAIVLIGEVRGPIPPHGTIIDLLVKYRGRWVPIPASRTDAAGRFAVEYKFQGATGRFPFRVKIPAGQAGFPFTSGYSNTAYVTTN
jgi:hypothetical protein